MLHITLTRFSRQIQPIPAALLAAQTKSCPTKKKVPKCPHTKKKNAPKAVKRGPIKGPKKTGKRGPTYNINKGPVCPGSGDGGSGPPGALRRPLKGGKVRLGFLPEEWFLFFHSKTGVTGPYLFWIMLTNYLVSKEKFVMEHEYYAGLSIFLMCYYAATALGPAIGSALDKEVDEVSNALEKRRKDEMAVFEEIITKSKESQMSAEGQKLLMDAKKENIAMQLEAIYRERLMQVYRTVKGRMDYQIKLYNSQARIQQKWMLGWILSHVKKSITPELENQAMQRAIQDLAAAAASRKK